MPLLFTRYPYRLFYYISPYFYIEIYISTSFYFFYLLNFPIKNLLVVQIYFYYNFFASILLIYKYTLKR